MALQEKEKFPAFRSDVRASGLAEVWTHTRDDLKFKQFGWRSTTKESSYSTSTLIGNWNEHRHDNAYNVEKLKPLPSQYAHYFETTSGVDYKKKRVIDDALRKFDLMKKAGKEPCAFPGHQPELDNAEDRAQYNSFMTTSRVGYIHPDCRRQPIE